MDFKSKSCKRKLMSIFKTLVIEPDMEWKMIDGSIVKAQQHACGARKHEERVIGKSVAGNYQYHPYALICPLPLRLQGSPYLIFYEATAPGFSKIFQK